MTGRSSWILYRIEPRPIRTESTPARTAGTSVLDAQRRGTRRGSAPERSQANTGPARASGTDASVPSEPATGPEPTCRRGPVTEISTNTDARFQELSRNTVTWYAPTQI